MRTTNRLLLLTLIVAVLFLAGWTAYGQKQTASKINWEYTSLLIPLSESDSVVPLLNAQGAKGWEVIQFNFRPGDTHAYFLLKRPK